MKAACRVIGIGGLVGLAYACESHPQVAFAPDSPVRAVYTNPKSGSLFVAREAPIEAAFSEAIDPESIDTTTFVVQDSSGSTVAGSVITSGAVVTFVPSAPLLPFRQYSASVNTGILALSGRALDAPRTWTFSTGGVVAFRASMAGSFDPGADTLSRVSLPVEAYDYGNDFNNGTSVFVAPIAGLYAFTARLKLDAPSTADDQTWQFGLGLNGTNSSEMVFVQANIGHKGPIGRTGSTLMHLNAGDTIELVTYQNGIAANRDVSNGVLEGRLTDPDP